MYFFVALLFAHNSYSDRPLVRPAGRLRLEIHTEKNFIHNNFVAFSQDLFYFI